MDTMVINHKHISEFPNGITVDGESVINSWHNIAAERDGQLGSIPTRAYRGIFRYFSVPIWEAGVAEEDLLYAMKVPKIWDGVTDPRAGFLSMPLEAQTIGKKYQFELEFVNVGEFVIMPEAVDGTTQSEVTVDATDAFRTYSFSFDLDATKITKGANLQFRIKRIAATSDEVAGEVGLIHWITEWKVDKLVTQRKGM